MSIVTTNNAYYFAIANAIRSKTNKTDLIYPSQMANLISEISGKDYVLINVKTDSTSPTDAAIMISYYRIITANKGVVTQYVRRTYTQSAVTIGGITISYNNGWKLTAALDYVYYNGHEYGDGATISTWGYDKSVNLWMYI